ncbi:putative glutathione S-transferase GSTU6 [Triticum urartu]|uniref:glutathione transferase n=1 Tax=Triticum urartu TaxID=4572 RepID=M7ZX95_TRIUA|nr:putative glutathione S-transferase GSTU6 [Triticum urartu]
MAAAAGGDEVKLLGVWDSPFVNRVQIVLNLKGISYQYVEEDLQNKGELLLASNPVHKKVPVLIHNGKPIPESQVIVQYIDEVWRGAGPSVLPAGPHERATARFWAAYVDDKASITRRIAVSSPPALSLLCSCAEVMKLDATDVLQVGSPWFTILFARKTEEKMEAAVRAISAMETLEGAFGECSGGKPFFGGDGIGFVDVVLGSYLGWFVVIEKMIGIKLLDAARTPALAAWAQRFRMAASVKGVLPEDVDKVLEFLQTFLD